MFFWKVKSFLLITIPSEKGFLKEKKQAPKIRNCG